MGDRSRVAAAPEGEKEDFKRAPVRLEVERALAERRILVHRAGSSLVDGVIEEAAGLKSSHTEEIHAFVSAIREGAPSPVPIDQTIKVIAILDAIVESGKIGKEVVVAPSTIAAANAAEPEP